MHVWARMRMILGPWLLGELEYYPIQLELPVKGRSTTTAELGRVITDLVFSEHLAGEVCVGYPYQSDHLPILIRKTFSRWNIKKLNDPAIRELQVARLEADELTLLNELTRSNNIDNCSLKIKDWL